jgi:hypothetical protein
MTPLDWYGIGALALIGLVFYFVRKVPTYVALSGAVALGFAVVTFGSVDWQNPARWIVLELGLLLFIFGLLIVRTMLIRSVSLHLLRRLETGQEGSMGEDIGGRLADMRRVGLIQAAGTGNTLTPFGRLIGGVVALFYALVRIKA